MGDRLDVATSKLEAATSRRSLRNEDEVPVFLHARRLPDAVFPQIRVDHRATNCGIVALPVLGLGHHINFVLPVSVSKESRSTVSKRRISRFHSLTSDK